jgi:hypothetical protein
MRTQLLSIMALNDGYLFFQLLTWGRICTSMTSWFSSESSGMETVVSHVVFSLVPLELKDYHVTNIWIKYVWCGQVLYSRVGTLGGQNCMIYARL